VGGLEAAVGEAGGAGYPQRAAGFGQGGRAERHDTEAGAIDVAHAGQVEHQLFLVLGEQVFHQQLDALALAAEGDLAGERHDRDVRWDLLGFNLEQHGDQDSRTTRAALYRRRITGGLPGVLGGGLRIGVKSQYGIEPGELEDFGDPLLRARHAKLPAALFDLVQTDHDGSHSGAIDVLAARQVEYYFPLTLAHQVLDHAFDFQTLRRQRDLAGKLDHRDVGIHPLGFDIEQHSISRRVWTPPPLS